MLAINWKMASGFDVVWSVLKLRRHVSVGCLRPFARFGMSARHVSMC